MVILGGDSLQSALFTLLGLRGCALQVRFGTGRGEAEEVKLG